MDEKFAIILVMSISLVSACAAPKKQVHKFDTPTGLIQCVEPNADVMVTGARANVEALIPQINTDVTANASVQTTVQRIRAEIPNLQAVEALEFRMCMSYGNRMIDATTYQEFFRSVLPLLKGLESLDNSPQSQELKYVWAKNWEVRTQNFPSIREINQSKVTNRNSLIFALNRLELESSPSATVLKTKLLERIPFAPDFEGPGDLDVQLTSEILKDLDDLTLEIRAKVFQVGAKID